MVFFLRDISTTWHWCRRGHCRPVIDTGDGGCMGVGRESPGQETRGEGTPATEEGIASQKPDSPYPDTLRIHVGQ